MREEILDLITKEVEQLPDEIFSEIYTIQDPVERTRYVEAIKLRAKNAGRKREADNLIKAWHIKHVQELKQEGSNKTEFTDSSIVLNCGDFIAKDTGVISFDYSNINPVKREVCPHPILPVERLINIDTGLEKTKIEYYKDNEWRSVTYENTTLLNKNHICVLADRGIMVTSENARELVNYLAKVLSLNVREIPLYRSISRLGWVNDKEFAPYVEDLKYDGDECFAGIFKHVGEKGDFEVWKKHMSELRADVNIRLMMSASFASPLIEIVGALPFVLHLWGTTGFGKTVSLMVAMSVWGNPEMGCLTRTMNMTQNSMARTASFLNSLPFAADELQQIKTKWDNYDNLIMYLTEGIDRGRAKARGGIEELKTWKNCFIFTGEEPVTKGESGGGVKNRVIEVEVNDKIIQDGNHTANLVKANYGFAGKLFMDYVMAQEDLREQYREIFKAILEAVDTTEKQAMSMALMLLADKLACECIFDGEEPLRVEDIKGCLTNVKAVDVAERAYEWCLNWIAENEIRFQHAGDDNKGAVWGKIEERFAMINKNVLVSELNKAGFDYTAISRAWADRGRIERNSQGYFVHQTKVFNTKASYIKLLFEEEPAYETIKIEEDDELPFKSLI